jgi:predicted DNA-binding antitoxin AbrB/MazE fold protein
MNEAFHAIYENGVLRPDRPLALPESAHVSVIIIGERATSESPSAESDDDFFRELESLAWDVPPLPADFSRADLYLDHD